MTSMKFASAVGLLVIVCLVAAAANGQSSPQAKPAAAGTVKVMQGAPAGPLPPLPEVTFTPVRPMPVIQQVYEFAARHPEVLQYVPCYCGCERNGHNGNHDCFVKSRATNGRIVEWDAHGLGCAICLEVGRRAMNLYAEKKSVVEIRNTIDREFGSNYPTHTPTPRPPQPAKKG